MSYLSINPIILRDCNSTIIQSNPCLINSLNIALLILSERVLYKSNSLFVSPNGQYIVSNEIFTSRHEIGYSHFYDVFTNVGRLFRIHRQSFYQYSEISNNYSHISDYDLQIVYTEIKEFGFPCTYNITINNKSSESENCKFVPNLAASIEIPDQIQNETKKKIQIDLPMFVSKKSFIKKISNLLNNNEQCMCFYFPKALLNIVIEYLPCFSKASITRIKACIRLRNTYNSTRSTDTQSIKELENKQISVKTVPKRVDIANNKSDNTELDRLFKAEKLAKLKARLSIKTFNR